jgi:hypothetical protein
MPKYKVGDYLMVKLSGGRIVEATVKAIVDRADGVRLQVSFGDETALIYLWQIVKEVVSAAAIGQGPNSPSGWLHSFVKRGATDRSNLRSMASVLDPTDERDVETEHGEAIEAPADERAGNRQAAPNPPRHISTVHKWNRPKRHVR